MPRSRNLFDPKSEKPFKLSRSKVELFLRCARCFYLDRRMGVGQPSGPPFTLNNAVDALLKKEFDGYRERGEPHPLMQENGVRAVPFRHSQLDTWRSNFVGVQHLHEATNLLVYGAVDDLWIGDEELLHVVDYKATSTDKMISLDDPWKQAYKRQMEFYQWLLRRSGFNVSNVGYFVYVNGLKDGAVFDSSLHFQTHLLSHQGSDDWVEQAIKDARACLDAAGPPEAAASCDWCVYRRDAQLLGI